MSASTAGVLGFNTNHLTNNLFKEILAGINKDAILVSWSQFDLVTSFGILADAETKGTSAKRIKGLFGYKIKYTLPGTRDVHVKMVVLKSKPKGEEVYLFLANSIPDLEENIVDVWQEFLQKYGFHSADKRELLLIEMKDPDVKSLLPEIYWSLMDEPKDIFVYVLEYFDPDLFSHVDSLHDTSLWKQDDILQVLESIAKIHAKYYGRTCDIPSNLQDCILTKDKSFFMDMAPLAQQLMKTNMPYCYNDVWDKKSCEMMLKIFQNVEKVTDLINKAKLTLLHDDFSLRNFCFRKRPTDGKNKLCVYDWEMVCIGLPQYDLAECLTYFMAPTSSLSAWNVYIESYFNYFQKELNKYSDSPSKHATLEMDDFKRVFDGCMMLFFIVVYGGLSSTLNRKFKWPQARCIYQTTSNYIHHVANKYSFLN